MYDCATPFSLTVPQAVVWATRQLDSKAIPGSRLESELLLGKVCASSRLELYLMGDRRLDRSESSRLSALVTRRMGGEPVQYLTGSTEFYGRGFAVAPGVLIPRPETERLVDHVRPFLQERLRRRPVAPMKGTGPGEGKACDTGDSDLVRFADIGTGTGVLAVTLALECPFATGYATDVSSAALDVARMNAASLLGDERRLRLLKGSLISPLRCGSIPPLDLIVSNPPYVATRELGGLPVEVGRFEPELALHGGEDGLDCHRVLIDEAPPYLKKGGMIALEIGGEHSGPVTRLMEDRGGYADIRIAKDYNGADRIVSATYAG